MGRLKILLVDDEADFLELMGARIKGWGYDLIKVRDGKKAIDTVKNKNPDIVVLDYIMPGMDGVEVLKQIRKTNNKIPVIMFTAHPDERSIKGAKQLGVSAFIPKLSVYSDAQSALKAALDLVEKKLGRKA